MNPLFSSFSVLPAHNSTTEKWVRQAERNYFLNRSKLDHKGFFHVLDATWYAKEHGNYTWNKAGCYRNKEDVLTAMTGNS